MADTTYVTIPELTEITRAETTDTAMLETAVEDQLTPTGYGSRRITLSSIASYVLSNFSSLSLGGVTRTVKAAIDAIATLLGSSSMGTTATTVTGAVSEVNTKANTNADNITTLTNSVNDLNSHLSDLDNQFKTVTVTATTSANGNISYGFGKKVYILAAWATRSDTFVCPYPVTNTDASGASTWWLNVRSATSAGAAVASTSVTVSVLYIEA